MSDYFYLLRMRNGKLSGVKDAFLNEDGKITMSVPVPITKTLIVYNKDATKHVELDVPRKCAVRGCRCTHLEFYVDPEKLVLKNDEID